jgi:hypothetical protein
MNRTHEELLQMENCKNIYCPECNCKMSCKGEKWTISELAADLLEARELIKEYHKIGKEVVAWNVSYRPLIDLLERTKEYAE